MNYSSIENYSKQPLISIIVPVYNVKEYLDDCINSLVGQTYTHLEIILIDDGSTDGSGQLCDIWKNKDPRIVVIHDSNHGVCHARNHGLRLAKGEFIGFADPDDWIDLNAYEEMVNAMISSQSDACGTGFVINSFDGGKILKNDKGNKSILSRDEAIDVIYSTEIEKNYLTWSLCDKLFSRKALKNVFFDESLHLSEDQLFLWHTLKNISQFVYIPLCSYHYRMRDGSATHTALDIKKGTYIDAINMIREDSKDMPEKVRYTIDCTFWTIVLNVIKKYFYEKDKWGSQQKDIELYLKHYQSVLRSNFWHFVLGKAGIKRKLLYCFLSLPYIITYNLVKGVRWINEQIK